MDALDVRLLELLTEEPELPVVECARRLQVARATVQGRLDKLHASGVVTGIVPRLDPGAMGFPLVALCQVQIDQQSGHSRAADDLARVPEVVDLYTVTGSGDLHVKIVARSTDDLQRVLDSIALLPAIGRTSTQIALHTYFSARHVPLLGASLER